MTLNELFVTKMCHDLAGSIGTLNNTTELLDMDASFVKESTALLKQSTAVLVARLKFFRALLGLETPIDIEIAQDYLKTLSMPIIIEGKVETRLHLILALLASEILIRGGRVLIEERGMTCTGKGLLLNTEKRKMLQDGTLDFKPQYAAVLWVRVFMKEHHQKIEIFENEEALTIQLVVE